MEILRIIEQAENLIEQNGFDKSNLAKKLGFPSRYIADIKAGKSKNPGSDFILALINKLNFNPLWLETGEGEMLLKKQEKSLESTSKANYKIPLLNQRVSCGAGVDWEDEQNIKGYIDIFSLIPSHKLENLYALCVQGNSMVGAGIKSGDYVIFSIEKEQYLDDDIYVFSLDGEVFCKQLEFDAISKRIKIYSLRVTDIEKAELLKTLDTGDTNFYDRFHIYGRVFSWIHPNYNDD